MDRAGIGNALLIGPGAAAAAAAAAAAEITKSSVCIVA